MFSLHNAFTYTDNTGLVVTVELPGVDPKNVKVSYRNNSIVLNNTDIVRVSDRYDLTKSTAELKHGLLRITVPETTVGKGEIPLTVL